MWKACRSLLYFVGLCEDKKHIAPSEEKKEIYQDLIDVLIPVAKGYVSDRAVEICDMGAFRCSAVTGIFVSIPWPNCFRMSEFVPFTKAPTAFRPWDLLLGRKLGMKQGKAFRSLLSRMQKTIAEAKAVASLTELADKTAIAVGKLGEAAMHLGTTGHGAECEKSLFLCEPLFCRSREMSPWAWMLLWRATVAAQTLEKGGSKKGHRLL